MRPRKVILHISTDMNALGSRKFLLETRGPFRVISGASVEEVVETARHSWPHLRLIIIDTVFEWLDVERLLRKLDACGVEPFVPRLLLIPADPGFRFASGDPTLVAPEPVELLECVRTLTARKPGPRPAKRGGELMSFPPPHTPCSERGCTNDAAVYADGAPICWACDEHPGRCLAPCIVVDDVPSAPPTATQILTPTHQEEPSMPAKEKQAKRAVLTDAVRQRILSAPPEESTNKLAAELGFTWDRVNKLRKEASTSTPKAAGETPGAAEEGISLQVGFMLTHANANALWSNLDLEEKGLAIEAVMRLQFEALAQ